MHSYFLTLGNMSALNDHIFIKAKFSSLCKQTTHIAVHYKMHLGGGKWNIYSNLYLFVLHQTKYLHYYMQRTCMSIKGYYNSITTTPGYLSHMPSLKCRVQQVFIFMSFYQRCKTIRCRRNVSGEIQWLKARVEVMLSKGLWATRLLHGV